MRHLPFRAARMTAHVSYIRRQSYNVEIDRFPCKRPAGRALFVREFWRARFSQSGGPSLFVVFYEDFAHMRGGEGGDARGGATILKAFWGSHV